MRRRRIPLPFAATASGTILAEWAGRLAGWALLDTGSINSVPATTNVLDGFLNAAGTLISIPANTAWYGTLDLVGEMLTPAAGVANVTGAAALATAAGLTPSAQTLAGLDITSPASTATGPGIVVADSATWGPGWIINSTAGALAVSLTTTLTKVDAWAAGLTLPFPGGLGQTVVELWNGNDATGVLLAPIAFPSGTSVVEALGDDGPDFDGGLFLRVVSGTVRGVVWVLV
jgi:hypothetical protein